MLIRFYSTLLRTTFYYTYWARCSSWNWGDAYVSQFGAGGRLKVLASPALCLQSWGVLENCLRTVQSRSAYGHFGHPSHGHFGHPSPSQMRATLAIFLTPPGHFGGDPEYFDLFSFKLFITSGLPIPHTKRVHYAYSLLLYFTTYYFLLHYHSLATLYFTLSPPLLAKSLVCVPGTESRD
jgi:hypothetical protein